MSTYEAQSWQVPARATSWEPSAPQSKPGWFRSGKTLEGQD